MHVLKRITTGVLAVALSLVSFGALVSASPVEPTVGIVVSDSHPTAGETIDVSIQVSDFEVLEPNGGLSGFNFDVLYDPAVFESEPFTEPLMDDMYDYVKPYYTMGAAFLDEQAYSCFTPEDTSGNYGLRAINTQVNPQGPVFAPVTPGTPYDLVSFKLKVKDSVLDVRSALMLSSVSLFGSGGGSYNFTQLNIPDSTIDVGNPVIDLQLQSSTTTIAKGLTLSLAPEVVHLDNRSEPIDPADVTWSSSDAATATVSGGVVTAVQEGSVTITGEYQGLTGTKTITVNPAAVTSVTLSDHNETLEVNASYSITASAALSDLTTQDVTTSATWTSSDDTVATVDHGLITAVQAGDAVITAAVNGYSDSLNVHVNSLAATPTVSSLTVNQPTVTLEANGASVYVPVIAHYSDLTTADVGHDAVWNIANTSIAYVNAMGEIRGTTEGTTSAAFTYGGQTVNLTITVNASTPIFDTMMITAGKSSLAVDETTQLTAVWSYINSPDQDKTSVVEDWMSTWPSVARVSPTGVVTAVSEGTTDIYATVEGRSQKITITVVSGLTPVVTGLTANPTNLVITAGTPHILPVITAAYSDNTTDAVTDDILWTTSTSGVVSIMNHQLMALNAGSTVLTASYEGQHVDIPVTVNPIGAGSEGTVSIPTATPTPTPTPPAKPEPTPTKDIFQSGVVQADTNVVKSVEVLVEAAKHTVSSIIPSDVKGHWAEKTMDTFTQLGVMKGYEDGTAKPDQSITRAEFVSILSRIFTVSGSKPVQLNDVNDHWASEAIKQYAAAGVIGGYGDGTFQPNKSISREEMVIILSRILNMNAVSLDSAKGNFVDLSSSYASSAIQQAAQAGIISGKGDGRFDPKSNSTRAEALTVILNTLNLNPQIKTLLDTL